MAIKLKIPTPYIYSMKERIVKLRLFSQRFRDEVRIYRVLVSIFLISVAALIFFFMPTIL